MSNAPSSTDIASFYESFSLTVGADDWRWDGLLAAWRLRGGVPPGDQSER